MTRILYFIAFISYIVSVMAIWPIPKEIKTGDTTVWLSDNVDFKFVAPKGTGYTHDWQYFETRIRKAIRRAKEEIIRQSFVPWKFHPKNSDFEPERRGARVIEEVKVVLTGKGEKRRPKIGEVDESYEVVIDTTGRSATATISAKTSIGILHGLETFKQLFYKHSRGGIYTPKAPVTIKDAPRFAYRGMNLDVARQWYPVEDIKRTISALAWNKFNFLHLHVTDSQSWPLEIPSMPDLARKGAYYRGLTYSPKDLQEILDHAEDRGMQVIVEIDMPGHTTVIAEAYPELIAARDIQPNWNEYAAQPPSGTLKLNNKNVENFVSKLFADLLPRLAKHTTYYHTGGDEVNRNAYTLDEGVKTNDAEVIKPLIARFVKHAHGEVHKYKFSPVVWEEMLLEWEVPLSKDTLVQSWISSESVKRIASAGYKVIAGNYNFWYLDCGHGQWLDFQQKDIPQFFPFNDYCAPLKNWRLMYTYDPVAGLTEEEAKNVVGGETHLWSEQTDSHNIDSKVWPRASAAGEILWSGRQDANGKNRTFEDASPRLAQIRERMVMGGVSASPIQQLWCHQNEGGCQWYDRD